jgi:hypothetical protein
MKKNSTQMFIINIILAIIQVEVRRILVTLRINNNRVMIRKKNAHYHYKKKLTLYLIKTLN